MHAYVCHHQLTETFEKEKKLVLITIDLADIIV